MYGGCLLYSSSRSQKVVALSSAESEVYASGASDSILLARVIAWLTGRRCHIHLYTDSSGVLQRQGVGRLRHLSCRILWLQQLISDGTIRIGAVSGNHNVADIGTKRLSAGRSLMSLLGMSNANNGSLEGSDDPGRIFARNGSIKTILSALNALSLLQLQGCNWITVNSDDGDVIVRGYVVFFTVVFCLTISIPILLRLWSWNGIGPKTGSEEPDDYEPTEPIQDADEDLDGAMDIDDERGVNFTAESLPRQYADWSPEAMLCRVYDRCSERMRRALRADDLERGARYTDRCRFLHGLMINLK